MINSFVFIRQPLFACHFPEPFVSLPEPEVAGVICLGLGRFFSIAVLLFTIPSSEITNESYVTLYFIMLLREVG